MRAVPPAPMKVNPKQIAASAAGAVAAAVVASLFGAKGTLLGIFLGSVVATTATALVVQSLERTHEAVRQVVRLPDRPQVLRRFGASRPAGSATGGTEETALTEAASGPDGGAAAGGTAAALHPGSDVGGPEPATARIEPQVPRLVASSRGGRGGGPGRPSGSAGSGRWRLRWPALAVSVAAVFVVALLVVTGIELLAGKPLSSVVGSGDASGGTSAGSLFSPLPTTTTLPPARSSTTTSTAPGTATSTTAPPSSTSTTGVQASTTTTGVGGTTTTTSTTTTTTTLPAPSSTTTATGG